MNGTFFALKRSHQASVRTARHLLGKLITPARYDMVYAIHFFGHDHGVLQGDLRKILGVTAPVISRMLKSLEALGVVYREIDEDDPRRRVVHLREKGRRILRVVDREIIARGVSDMVLARALTAVDWPDLDTFHHAIFTLEHRLRMIRVAYRDIAKLDYYAKLPSLRTPEWIRVLGERPLDQVGV